MTYIENIQKVEVAALAELYHFYNAYGDEYYTSAKETINFGGNNYKPASITRTNPGQSLEFKVQTMTITAGITPMFAQYANSAPLPPMSVDVFSAIAETPGDYIQIFSGTIADVQFSGKTVSATVEAFSELVTKKIPPYAVQSACNFDVFDPETCKADPLLFDLSVTADINGQTISHADFALVEDQYYRNGKIYVENDPRFIISHVGNILKIQFPFPSNISGPTAVVVFPGCDGLGGTCLNKFNNLENFCGMPYCPGDNKNPAVVGFV